MAMLRSALGKASRRLLALSATPSVMTRRVQEIHQFPPLSSHRIPDLQGWQHYPVISKGTEGLKQAEQKRSLSMERNANKTALSRLEDWVVRHFGPRRQAMFLLIVGVPSVLATTIAYRRINSHYDTWVMEGPKGQRACRLCGKTE